MLVAKESNGPLLKFYDVSLKNKKHFECKSVTGQLSSNFSPLNEFKHKKFVFQGGNQGIGVIDIESKEMIS